MDKATAQALSDSLTQSQAAALAVLAANIRKQVEQHDAHDTREMHLPLNDLLQDLEDVAIMSIQKNDGNVVEHIGTAAKQMNPLLS